MYKRQAKALRSDKAVSLLPVGVLSADGEWEEGDIVSIIIPSGETIGVGRASVSSSDLATSIGKKGQKPVIHYDYLFLE